MKEKVFLKLFLFLLSRKHEYEKHGTCAATVPGLETEHEFFKNALDLRDKYDMGRYDILVFLQIRITRMFSYKAYQFEF